MIILLKEVHDVINGLSCDKSSDLNRVVSAHLKCAGYKLSPLVALFVTSVFIHAIVNIFKDTNKRIDEIAIVRYVCLVFVVKR